MGNPTENIHYQKVGFLPRNNVNLLGEQFLISLVSITAIIYVL